MLEFFREWKHKVGCVTLVLACLFVAGWVRSLTIRDAVYFGDSNWTSIDFVVLSSFSNITTIVESWPKKRGYPVWTSDRLDDPEIMDVIQSHELAVKWDWRFCGFGRGVEVVTNTSKRTRTVIPYWSIVVPLTAISAWLPQSKTRTKVESTMVPASENT